MSRASKRAPACACARQGRPGLALLVRHGFSTLSLETDTADGFREPGFTKRQRVEQQIAIGLLAGADIGSSPVERLAVGPLLDAVPAEGLGLRDHADVPGASRGLFVPVEHHGGMRVALEMERGELTEARPHGRWGQLPAGANEFFELRRCRLRPFDDADRLGRGNVVADGNGLLGVREVEAEESRAVLAELHAE